MTSVAILLPIALLMGLAGLVTFFWALRRGQFDDLEGGREPHPDRRRERPAAMNAKAVFGLIALLPAALGPVAVTANALVAALCTGDGHSRSITIPLQPALPGSNDMCCAKGCHRGSSRKRAGGENVCQD